MSVILWVVWVYHLVRLIGRSVCSKKVVEDFWNVHFSCTTVEGKDVDSNLDGFSSFSGNLFAVLVYYLEVGDVGFGGGCWKYCVLNCTGNMAVVFFYSISKHLLGFPVQESLQFSSGQDHL